MMHSLPAEEFAARRAQLMQHLGADAIALLPAARRRLRNRDTEYPFRQDSDFYYLSGFPEEDAVLVLAPGRKEGEYLLFCHEHDPVRELWDGPRAGMEGACERYGADQAFPLSELDRRAPELLAARTRLHYPLGRDAGFDERVGNWFKQLRAAARSGVRPPEEVRNLDALLHEMRLRKSARELELMRSAGAISARAHRRAMACCRPGMHEYELEAELLHEFVRSGARHTAYGCIVGAGHNACVLHYVDNNSELQDGDMVVIDAGCELDLYAADITRSFPVNGRFSTEQRAVYEIVLQAQEDAIAAARPGNSWESLHLASLRTLVQGLADLEILQGEVDALIEEESWKPFYPHRIGHWLGMDVHDAGVYRNGEQWRALEAGMVTTVEPGLYFRAGTKGLDPRWHGIAVRIEDDVLVGENGAEIINGELPRTVEEVEEVMRAGAA